MKLDPGMHIGMHLVSFGKSGVTSLEVDNPLLLLHRILQQVGLAFGPLCQRLPQNNKIVNNASITCDQTITTCHGVLIVSAVLMVMMLVRKACMSSMSSNQSSCQGV
jgi:hypothetical protein